MTDDAGNYVRKDGSVRRDKEEIRRQEKLYISANKKTTKKSSKSASKKSKGQAFEAGLSLSAECFGRVSISGGLVFDTQGHTDIAITLGGGTGTFGAGAMGFLSGWSGDISNIHGGAINNVGVGPSIGYNIAYNSNFNTIVNTISFGAKGEPFWEQHCEYTNTFFDFGDHVYVKQFP